MIRLALYKGKGNWVNALIRWRIQSIYSHCEIIANDYWYSSTVHDGGVRVKKFLSDELSWDIIEIPFIAPEQIENHFNNTKNKPYGWLDLFQSQLLGRRTGDNRGDFCSEWCADALGLESATRYSPGLLGEVVKWAVQVKK